MIRTTVNTRPTRSRRLPGASIFLTMSPFYYPSVKPSSKLRVLDKGQQGQVTSAFHFHRQLALLFLRQAGFDPGHDHALTGNEVFEHLHVFITKNVVAINRRLRGLRHFWRRISFGFSHISFYILIIRAIFPLKKEYRSHHPPANHWPVLRRLAPAYRSRERTSHYWHSWHNRHRYCHRGY